MIRRAFAGLLAAGLFRIAGQPTGQTASQIKAAQLANGTGPAGSVLRLLAIDSGGRFYSLTVGAGMDIADFTLSASEATNPQILYQRTDGTYPYTGAGGVFRNGILQCLGVDYKTGGGLITPVLAWGPDDIVLSY